MKEFLMELYLQYGEQRFSIGDIHRIQNKYLQARNDGYIGLIQFESSPHYLTPKAIEYLKHD